MQVKVRTRALAAFFLNPEYTVNFIGWSLVLLFLFQWLFAIDLLLAFVEQDGFGNIFRFMIDNFIEFLRLSPGDFIPLALIVVAIFQAATITIVREIAKHEKTRTRTTRTVVLALFGSGCVACSGSIIAPLLSSLGVVAAASVSVRISMVVLSVAIAVAVFSLWQVLSRLATMQAKGKV